MGRPLRAFNSKEKEKEISKLLKHQKILVETTKAGPLRKKELFLKLFFLFCCHLKIKIILL